VRARNLIRERPQRRPEPVIAQHDRLEHERQIPELADRRPLLPERRLQDPPALGRVALLERMHCPIQHQRDPRKLLHRPVVQEQRQPPPLVLLGGDQPLERVVALHESG
jgi:hypothetical protein